tara:strand:+ start:167 stop:493 length:327 start_codon:yes stop_codon:yes gene_type:complete
MRHADFFNTVLKPKMIEMAINDEFPLDLTQLSFEDLVAEDYDEDREFKIENLAHYICDDEDRYESMEKALTLLEEQDDIDGSVMADDIVMMWEKVEGSMTVGELLDAI